MGKKHVIFWQSRINPKYRTIRKIKGALVTTLSMLLFLNLAYALTPDVMPTMDELEYRHEVNLLEHSQDNSYPIVHVIPDENEIPLEKAYALAVTEMYKRVGTIYTKYNEQDIEACELSSTMYLDYPEEASPFYMFSFSQTIPILRAVWTTDESEQQEPIICFTVEVLNHGNAITVEYNDPYSMRNICWIARMYHVDEHGKYIPSAFWSLEDKAKLYEQLVNVKEREMSREGEIPKGYIRDHWMAHVHSQPTENEIQPEEALQMAEDLLKQQNGENEIESLIPGIWFYRDIEEQPVYDVWFCSQDGEIKYRFVIPAND